MTVSPHPLHVTCDFTGTPHTYTKSIESWAHGIHRVVLLACSTQDLVSRV